MNEQLEDLADEFDVELEFEDVEPDLKHGSDAVDMEAKEATVIKPFRSGKGFVKDEHHNFVLEDQSQFSVTVKYRVECPSCQHILADDNEPNQLSGECTVCGVETCHRCQNRCSGCGTILCPDCTRGHGLKDEVYCSSCRSDVVEDIGFERGLEKREQNHKETLDHREQQLKEEKQRTELELQEMKAERDQIRQDWKTIIHAINVMTGDGDDNNGDSQEADVDGFTGSGSFSGGGGFSGSGAFTGNKEYSSGDSSTPAWLENEFNDLEE